MGIIEQITTTHIALDLELARLQRLLDSVQETEFDDETWERLRRDLGQLKMRLNAHLRKEKELERRSERILGVGVMEDYDVVTFHRALREALEELARASEEERAAEEFWERVLDFVALFEAYTENELRFLSTHANVLFPGGATD